MSKKRRQFTAEFKFEVVLEGLQGEKPIAQICRERDITEKLYYEWREQFLARAASVFERQGKQDQQASEQAGQIADLERMVGRLTMENEILKKAKRIISQARAKNGHL